MTENQKLAEIAKLKEKMLSKMNQSKLMGGSPLTMIPGCCGQGCCEITKPVTPIVITPGTGIANG